jgi:hypothetical protein
MLNVVKVFGCNLIRYFRPFFPYTSKFYFLKSSVTTTVYMYSCVSVSAGNTVQGLSRLRETADNTECFIYETNINTVQFNS